MFIHRVMKGHSESVRCLDVLRDIEWTDQDTHEDEYHIFSGSRDKSVMVWGKNTSLEDAQPDTAYLLGAWVYSLAAFVLPLTAGENSELTQVSALKGVEETKEKNPGQEAKGGKEVGLAVGMKDGQIQLLKGPHPLRLEPVGSLCEHSAPVCSLAVHRCTTGGPLLLLSGGWDDTALVWDLATLTCLRFLANHENHVCVLGLPNGDIVTGSTGFQVEQKLIGFQLRLWQDGAVIKTNETSHQAGIRDLCLVDEDSVAFVTASNDSTVRLFSEQLDCLETFVADDGSFVYSVAYLGEGKFAAGLESGVVMMMKRGCGVIQAIRFSKSIWAVKALPNQNFIAAGEERALFICTENAELALSEDVMKTFLVDKDQGQDNTKTQKSEHTQSPNSAAHLERFRGAIEGAISLFSDANNHSHAYRWTNGFWEHLGPVVSPLKKEELGGSFYDMVVPVEIDSKSKGFISFMLGFNRVDDPEAIARQCCADQDIPDEYIQQIKEFIEQCQQMLSL